MQKLIKDAEKPRKLNLTNFNPSTSSHVSNFNGFNPFPALTNLQALHQLSTRSPPAPQVLTQELLQTNPSENPSGVAPLDLSSSGTPPLAKRIKLSPTTIETHLAKNAVQMYFLFYLLMTRLLPTSCCSVLLPLVGMLVWVRRCYGNKQLSEHNKERKFSIAEEAKKIFSL